MEEDDPELETLLAEGKIDQETYDRLRAREAPRTTESDYGGMLAGSGAIALGLGLCYLVASLLGFDPIPVAVGSLLLGSFLAALAIRLVRPPPLETPGVTQPPLAGEGQVPGDTGTGQHVDLGRALAIAANQLLTQAIWVGFAEHFDPDLIGTVLLVQALVSGALAYLSTSSLVLLDSCIWLSFWLTHLLSRMARPGAPLGPFAAAFAALGLVHLLAGRAHLVSGWPRGVAARRFAIVHQTVGLNLLNWAVLVVAWLGWTGDRYHDVYPRLAAVAATVIVLGIEVWAGRKSGLPWVTTTSIGHFLVQCTLILYYPYIPFRNRAVIVMALGLLMIVVALGRDRGKGRAR